MGVYSKQLLSGSSNGLGILITGTATTALTTIHTAVTGTSGIDEAYAYAVNTTTTAVKLTVLYGDAGDASQVIEQTINGENGLELVLPGIPIQNAKIIKGFAGTANVIAVHGWVNRVT
jgi:hypothetical protein|tara:strand:+ start:5930 stop:6283 length:354 start_codon:yes stop_codon:yes gene_type:complete